MQSESVIYCLKVEKKVYCVFKSEFVSLEACRKCYRYCYELMDMVVCKWKV